MPFDAYTKIEDNDLKALWAYVRRIARQDLWMKVGVIAAAPACVFALLAWVFPLMDLWMKVVAAVLTAVLVFLAWPFI
jgi:hypothetical protein